ncbi:zinc ribbon domain-containing protein [Paenibacillus sp. FSL H7-0350]|uniref:zinc ribbon domain-containing protein n=1 Tax=Paenibacillus sp. FSL H7-0350 TaxID=2975345 RepID=UPI003158EADD
MFCSNCGTKLDDNAKFCFNCGTKTIGVNDIQESPQSEGQQQSLVGQKPQSARTSQTESFNLLGYEVELPKKTKDYIFIRGEFQQLAWEAREQMSRNFGTKYHNLDDLIRHGDSDADDLIGSAMEHAIEMLKRFGVYHISLSRFTDVAYEYIGNWEENFSEIREKFKELVEYKEAKKEYRSDRKSGRGRMVGGGFGLGGAMKGMAMAGTANMTTGLLHSFSNAMGNAATSAEVNNLKNKIFKDPDTKKTLCLSVYFDIYYIHRAVVECINDSGVSLAAESYTSIEQEKASIIYNNIMDGSVRNEDRRRMIAEILVKDPFDIDYYELALKYSSDEDESDLINYARYFEVPIDQLIQDLNAAIESEQRLAQLFGDYTVELEQKLKNNNLYQAIKSELADQPTKSVQRAFFSIQNESVKSKLYLIQGEMTEKLLTKLANAKASYAPIQDEAPILLFDNTAFGSAKDGFLITDQNIYAHNMMAKGLSISLQGLQEMRLSGSAILIDGQSVDINLISGKDRSEFYEFVELLVFVQKYGGGIGTINGTGIVEHSRASSELQLSKTEVAVSLAATSNSMKNKDKIIKDIKDTILSIKNEGIRKYLFLENENEKVTKKYQNAFEAYAKLEADERAIVLFDNTGFGSAKDGFLITSRRIHIHNMLQKPVTIDISSVVSVNLKGAELLFNQQAVGINMISSSARSEFRSYIENFVNQLK